MASITILSVLVENNSGVLLRISGLFSRRGYSIQSISSAETEDPYTARLTIVVYEDEHVVEQICKQLEKLIDVMEVTVVDERNAVLREHAIIQCKNEEKTRSALLEIVSLCRVNVIDVAKESLILELTGSHRKISRFIKLVEPYGIIKLVRTGVTALEREDY